MRQYIREFTKKLKVDFGDAEFIFTHVSKVVGMRQFFVSVKDSNDDPHFFNMEAKGGKWIILEKKLPEWILKRKDELSDAIIEFRGKYP